MHHTCKKPIELRIRGNRPEALLVKKVQSRAPIGQNSISPHRPVTIKLQAFPVCLRNNSVDVVEFQKKAAPSISERRGPKVFAALHPGTMRIGSCVI